MGDGKGQKRSALKQSALDLDPLDRITDVIFIACEMRVSPQQWLQASAQSHVDYRV